MKCPKCGKAMPLWAKKCGMTTCMGCVPIKDLPKYTYLDGMVPLPPMYTLEPTATEHMIEYHAEFKFNPMDKTLNAIGRAFDDAIDLAAL